MDIFYNVKHYYSTRQFSDLEFLIYIVYCTDKLHAYIVLTTENCSFELTEIMLCDIVFTISYIISLLVY